MPDFMEENLKAMIEIMTKLEHMSTIFFVSTFLINVSLLIILWKLIKLRG